MFEKIKSIENLAISKDGRVVSLARVVKTKAGSRNYHERELKVSIGNHGRNAVQFNGKTLLISRLIYEAFVGEIPKDMDVDHKNDNKLDDRVENLQLLNRRQNVAKEKSRFRNLPTGVYKAGKKFAAELHYKGRKVYLGRFLTPEEASFAYNNKIKELCHKNIRQLKAGTL